MNFTPFLSRFLVVLLLVGFGWSGSLGADAEDPTPDLRPEQEAPPALETPNQPETPPTPQPRKRGNRRRARPPHPAGAERVEFGRDVHIPAGETVHELVVIAGNAIVDGTVEDALVVISGSVRVNGEVGGDLVTVLGPATLGAQAHVGGNAVVVGGPFKKNANATVGGQQTVISLGHLMPNFTWLQGWIANGLLLARPFPPQVKWVWIVAGVFLLLYLAVTVLFPRPVRACVEALEDRPISSFFVGVLLSILFLPVMVLLAITVAGVLIIPFMICGLIAAAVFGKVAVYTCAGRQLGRQMHIRDTALPLLLLLGAALCYVLYMVPVVGFAAWGLITLLGLGAVLLACFGTFRHDEVPAYAAEHALSVAVPGNPATQANPATPSTPPLLGAGDVLLLPRVGFWRRLWATVLDFLLLGVTLIPLTGPLFLIIWAAYYIAMWTWKGTSIGGVVLNIKVVRLDGQPIDFAVALVRSLSSFFSAFALFLGFFWAGWDRERQAWHDKIAGTVVVKVPRGMSLI